jgi:hypothetical protein
VRVKRAAWFLSFALAAAASCRSSRTGLLTASPPAHDFGAVVDGDPLRHTFAITNAGRAPVRVARVAPSPACRPVAVPAGAIAPGSTIAVEIECDSRNRPPNLADAVFVIPDDGGPALRLELRGTIRPLLAFDPALVTLETPPGQSTSRIVRLVGPAALLARPRVANTGAAEGLSARVVASDDPRGPGVEIVLTGRTVGAWSDRVLVATGIDRPRELTLPYTARVTSGIEIEPAKPYFNLRDPGGRSRTLAVTSRRAGFRVLAAEVITGPFRATVESGKVRVDVDEAGVPVGERGIIGELVIVTNDDREPRKNVQLFAMGALARSSSGTPPPAGP